MHHLASAATFWRARHTSALKTPFMRQKKKIFIRSFIKLSAECFPHGCKLSPGQMAFPRIGGLLLVTSLEKKNLRHLICKSDRCQTLLLKCPYSQTFWAAFRKICLKWKRILCIFHFIRENWIAADSQRCRNNWYDVISKSLGSQSFPETSLKRDCCKRLMGSNLSEICEFLRLQLQCIAFKSNWSMLFFQKVSALNHKKVHLPAAIVSYC